MTAGTIVLAVVTSTRVGVTIDAAIVTITAMVSSITTLGVMEALTIRGAEIAVETEKKYLRQEV